MITQRQWLKIFDTFNLRCCGGVFLIILASWAILAACMLTRLSLYSPEPLRFPLVLQLGVHGDAAHDLDVSRKMLRRHAKRPISEISGLSETASSAPSSFADPSAPVCHTVRTLFTVSRILDLGAPTAVLWYADIYVQLHQRFQPQLGFEPMPVSLVREYITAASLLNPKFPPFMRG